MLLCFAFLISFIFLFFQIAAAAVTIQYSYTLRVGSVPSGSLTSLQDVTTNNVLMSAFMKCCTGCPNGICNNPNPGAYYNGSLPYCASPKDNCTTITVCSGAGQTNCLMYTPQYQAQFGSMVPPVTIPDNVCSQLSRTSFHGHHVVGYASSGDCGGGDPQKFMYAVAHYVESVLGGVSVVFVLVAVIQFFIVALAIYIICKPTFTGKSGFEDDMTHINSKDEIVI